MDNWNQLENGRGSADTISLLQEDTLPAVTLRGLTILPGMVIHFDLSRETSMSSVEQAMLGDQRLLVVSQKDPGKEEPGMEDIYDVGTVTLIRQVSKLPEHVLRVLVEGVSRARIHGLSRTANGIMTQVSYERDDRSDIDEITAEAMTRTVKEALEAYGACFPKVGKAVQDQIEEGMELGKLLDSITINMPLPIADKQKILSAISVRERFSILTEILTREVEVIRIKSDLAKNIRQRIDKNQRDYILREQMQYIKEELGENNTDSDVEQFLAEAEKLKATPEVKEKIRKEIKRYKNVAGSGSESAVERAYIETLLELPWDKASRDSRDLEGAEKILNEQHYGLEKVKERMLEFLAVRMLTGKAGSQIICLVGPPGTGKTSVAKSVAEALKRKYVRICLGGVRDEAEIRGHRKTYVGAMPGRVVAAVKQAGVKNPLMLLDEIDKLGSDYKGDPASALLEVLDGEQNHAFRDHYVEIPIDLSEVFFIATANSRDGIPRPLLDRMEIIEVNSYTANEKFHIAREHLVAKAFQKNGIREGEIAFSDEAVRDIVRFYTREAGVRSLERQIGAVCRKEARAIFDRRKQKLTEEVNITPDKLEHYLGKPKYRQDKINEKPEVGIVRGLAWTSVGGDTLQIEVNVMPGEGKIDLTGQMGDVMKESARTALSYVRSVSGKYKVAENFYKKKDFHIHIPEGAVPKDGPSAGITMATALLSAVTHTPVRADLAMTGEVTLRGRILPIGGLKEKILAAKMAEVKTVLVPKENEKDIEEISEEIKEGLEILFVETMEEVADLALLKQKQESAK
ncbi:MAG: endopeptidase La [Lachnospiraceae bacterium]|nr:endopeptidase La [Lachnospiraceae bacterium]